MPPHEPHSFSVPAMSLEDLPDAKQGGKLAQGAEPELKLLAPKVGIRRACSGVCREPQAVRRELGRL